MRERRKKPTYWMEAAVKILRSTGISKTAVGGGIVWGIVMMAAERHASSQEASIEGELPELIEQGAKRMAIDLSSIEMDMKEVRGQVDSVLTVLRRAKPVDIDAIGKRQRVLLQVDSPGRGAKGRKRGLYKFRLFFVKQWIGDPSEYWGETLRTELYNAIEEIGFVDCFVHLDDIGEAGALIADEILGAHRIRPKNLRPFTRGIAEAFAHFLSGRIEALNGPDAVGVIQRTFRLSLSAEKITTLDFYPSMLRSIHIGPAGNNDWRRYADVIVKLPGLNLAERIYATKLLDICSTWEGEMPPATALVVRSCRNFAETGGPAFEERFVPNDTPVDDLLDVLPDHERALSDFRKQLALVWQNPRHVDSNE